MTLIAATVQRPAPKSDREMARSHPETDLRTPPDRGRPGAFGDVLREIAEPPSTPSSDEDRDDAAEPRGPVAKGRPDEATVTPALSPADPASAAATVLANVLNTAHPAAASDAPATGGSPGPRTTAPDAAARSAPALVRGAGSAQGLLAGSGPKPDVTVLDRAVHFKPVLPPAALPESGAAEAAPAASGAPTVAGQNPARTGLSDVIATAARTLQAATGLAPQGPADTAMPAEAAPAASGAPFVAGQNLARPGLGDIIATAARTLRAATGLAPQDPADTAVRAAITAPGTSDLSVPADSHAVPGIARTILAAAGHQSRAGSSVPTPRDSVGTETGLPAITLPMIAAAIEDEIARAVPARPDAVGNHADPATGTAPDGPLRVLRIQLRPEELGTVTVELRLANGQLETHLRASRPETAALLQRDAAILTDLLKQAHHQADVTVAQARPADAGGSAEGAPSQGQSSFANGGARPGHGEDGQRQAAHRSATGRRDGERIDETIRPRDGGIYL